MITKRFLAIFATVVIAVTSIHSFGQWRYGFRLGGEFTTPTKKEKLPEIKGGNGFAGGVAFEWQMPTSGLAIGPSLIYERRNLNYHLGHKGENLQKIGGDFIAVPIDIKYKFWLRSISGLAAPYILTGPDLAMRLNGNGAKNLHFGWNVGVGFDIINFIQIYGGYRFGLNNIAPNGYPSVKDSGVFVAANILFDF